MSLDRSPFLRTASMASVAEVLHFGEPLGEQESRAVIANLVDRIAALETRQRSDDAMLLDSVMPVKG